MNYHLARLCYQQNIPYLPVNTLLFRAVAKGAANGAAPTRKLVTSRGVLGGEGKVGIGTEIVR